MQFAQLLQLRETGINIPDEVILEATTLQNKKDLVEAVTKANEEQQQIQQMQIQTELKEIEARIELSKARSVADTGLGLERVSRVKENEAFAIERRAEARKDNAQGMLNIVRAIKELDTVDIQQLQQLISISQMLSAQNKSDEMEANKSEASSVAKSVQRATPSTPVARAL